MSLQLPNPSTVSDQLAALLQAVAANPITAPVAVIKSLGGAAGHQSYAVVASCNGGVVPSANVATTTGPTTLSATAYNTITWSPLLGVETPVTYSIYRVTGGAAQGLIASGLTIAAGQALGSFVDNGVAANTALTVPPFITLGVNPANLQVVSGAIAAITIPEGNVLITYAGAAAISLPAPISGSKASGGQDGCKLRFYTTTNNQHVITTAADGFNGADDTATMAATASSYFEVIAYGGVWYTFSALNIAVLSEV